MYGTNPIRFYNSLTHVKREGVWQSVPKSLGTLVFNIMQLVTPASSEKKNDFHVQRLYFLYDGMNFNK